MLRRRYRLFAICASCFVFLLYRAAQGSWNSRRQAQPIAARVQQPLVHPALVRLDGNRVEPAVDHTAQEPLGAERSRKLVPNYGADKNKKKQSPPPPPELVQSKEKAGERGGFDTPTTDAKDAGNGTASDDDAGDDDILEQDPDGTETPLSWSNPPKDSESVDSAPREYEKHWTRPAEHFPVPSGSMVPLPAGPARNIPKIQHHFGPESAEARAIRLSRLDRVKQELVRSWAGYRKHAWMHDELSPVSGRHRDPFCGWSATLVDTLDTLWIVGLKNEFDEAAKAVKHIDFTYTPRPDIPVFETTIRYLGGLIAAYDVSGGSRGAYSFLLDKAVELAEILMGIFDTPNRMPVLYYRWQPKFASQPHRAGQVGIAELGSLSMEFTRLAQLTGQDRYYDAIDRITNALVAMQQAGTLVPGLFPENIDASGCNRTATDRVNAMSADAKLQVASQAILDEPKGFSHVHHDDLDSVLESNRRKEEGSRPLSRRAVSSNSQGPFTADGRKSEWDCVPQGLVPASYEAQKFHVGGSQDSAYEYFPKEYLLLGGRVAKYQKLYEDAVNAINKQLLFQPMTLGDWDVLFPAKMSSHQNVPGQTELDYEVTHLTCFVGGMYVLGGRLFSREEDIEIAKKLTNGCVWAYQSTPSGIMPEFARTLPCPTQAKCDFNETLWWENLDGYKSQREADVREWMSKYDMTSPARFDQSGNHDAERGSSTTGVAASATKELRTSDAEVEGRSGGGSVRERAAVSPARGQRQGMLSGEDQLEGSVLPTSLRKKLDAKVGGVEVQGSAKSSLAKGRDAGADGSSSPSVNDADGLEKNRKRRRSTIPQKPQTHEEFVKEKLKRERLPPGFVSVPGRQYILRPEAIESVWYMYRISGDDSWMDKGWGMFEATVQATRTALASSTIDDVLAPEPRLKDEMESFWMAETLKYYYLLFSDPVVVSLDEWVLNTEAHPFKL